MCVCKACARFLGCEDAVNSDGTNRFYNRVLRHRHDKTGIQTRVIKVPMIHTSHMASHQKCSEWRTCKTASWMFLLNHFSMSFSSRAPPIRWKQQQAQRACRRAHSTPPPKKSHSQGSTLNMHTQIGLKWVFKALHLPPIHHPFVCQLPSHII